MRWAVALVLSGCAALDGASFDGGAACVTACRPDQLCVQGYPFTVPPACVTICANELHCLSRCCVPVGETGYLACAATEVCFGPTDAGS